MSTKNIKIETSTDELEEGLTLECCYILSARTGVILSCTRTYSGNTVKVMKAAIEDVEDGCGWTIEEIVGGKKTCVITLSNNY